MDDYITQILKILSKTIIVRIYSYPQFSIEVFLAFVVCVVHFLLIFEINTLVRRTNAIAAARLQLKQPIKDMTSCSYHSITSFRTSICPKKIDTYSDKPFCVPFKPPKLHRKFSAASNFGWVISQGDSILRDKFTEKVEHMLSISPSEYVRRDKERKNREEGLKTCIQSLTSLLEKALNIDNPLDFDRFSKEAIRKSIMAIKDNLSKETNEFSRLTDFPTSSLRSLIAEATGTKAIQNSLAPNLVSSIYRATEMNKSQSNFDNTCESEEDDSNIMKQDDDIETITTELMVNQSCSNVSELFKQQFFEGERTESGVNVAS